MWERIKRIDKKVWLIVGAVLILILAITGWIIYDIAENQRIDAEAITWKPELTASFGESVKVSDFLENLNGELVEDITIDTSQLGEITVSFEYINIKHKRRQRELTIQVVDATAPTIYGGKLYSVPVNYAGKLTDLMLSGDDLDDQPQREIAGNYDLTVPGDYAVEYVVTDDYNNTARQNFTLRVYEPQPNPPQPPVATEKLPLSQVITQHKTTQTKIGIDVSSWQGEIDWPAVKAAGVEFAFIRVGYQVNYDTEYILDKYFQANLTGASQAGLPIGVYFYSYANTTTEAQRQAEWIIAQLGDTPVELGIAFDWEDWADFNNAKMSFRTINQVAKAFLDTAAARGYQGVLYSSKNYLERIWQPEVFPEYPIWLAQYYHRVTYDGKYWLWQLSSSGQVPGIYGDVDLDIMYLEK